MSLTYAIVNFQTEEITWLPMGFTTKRRNALLKAIELVRNNPLVGIDCSSYENIF